MPTPDLPLMLAIGELQKAAGPDQRITATADVLGGSSTSASWPKLVGVWRSWEGSRSKFDPANKNVRVPIPPAKGYEYAKEDRFLTWLASHPDATSYTLPSQSPPANDRTIVRDFYLVDISSNASGGSGKSKTGSYSWIVYDEGVKAKLRTSPQAVPSPPADLESKASRFAATERYGTEVWDKFNSVPQYHKDFGKANTLSQSALMADTPEAKDLLPHFHDLTVHSKGLLVDVDWGRLEKRP